jgi:general stress protein 26
MLVVSVAASLHSNTPPPRIDHVRGLDALPFVTRALARFEPAVLMTADGLGAIHASRDGEAAGESPAAAGRTFWFLADARTLLDWEAHRRQLVTLSFQSPDERVYFTLSGRTEVVTDATVLTRMWRPAFKRWFQGGPSDPRLLLVQFSTYDAEFYQTSSGRVTSHLTH